MRLKKKKKKNELFFSLVYIFHAIIGADQLISFPLLVMAFDVLPRLSQLLDELSVLVDPRTFLGIQEVYPFPRTVAETRAYQRALHSSIFVLRASWVNITKSELREFEPVETTALEQLNMSELDCFLETFGLERYKRVFAKCKVYVMKGKKKKSKVSKRLEPSTMPRL